MNLTTSLKPRGVTSTASLRCGLALALCVGGALGVWSPTALAAGCVPTVELTSPTEGAQVAAPATFILSATAGGCAGITNVKFKANGVLVNTDNNAPYTFTWTGVAAGTYAITATASTLLNSTTTAPVTIISGDGGGGGGNVAPTVSMTAPADGATAVAPASPILRAIASDYDGTVSSVEFWSNGALLGTDTTAPYRWPLSGLAAGTYQFKAVARDDGGLSTTSGQVTYTVTGEAPIPDPPSTVSATRTYVYDDNMRLCKTINPESGATVVAYDAAGNIDWTADGTTLTSNTCDRDNVAAALKTTRTYDARNRLLTIVTPGGTANVTTEYEPDGLVKALTAANPGGVNVVTTYSYNKRRLLTAETSTNGATLYTLGYGYNGNGHLGALTYPDGLVVTYAPDALGRATQVIGTKDSVGTTYASGLSYFPGGAISGFTYGNGLVHTMTQNTRRLPARSRDASGALVVLDDSYAFDENGNVTDITDQAQAGKTTRGMSYDDLDRLTAAVSPNQWGDATFSYDALDNLRSADVVKAGVYARQYRYNYDLTSNRLNTISNPAGVTQITLQYDAAGNTLRKVGSSTQDFVFDAAHRMNEVTGSQV